MGKSANLGRTISGGIQDNEAGVDHRLCLPMLKLDGIRMPAQSIRCLVNVYIVMRSIQSPERADTSAATTDDSDFLSRKFDS
jgi:hypothetical protein